jgi:hypothetical protein
MRSLAFAQVTGVATQVCRVVTPAAGGASSTGGPICIAIPVQGSCLKHPPGDRQPRLGPQNPQMLFKSGERLLGTERALLLAALGLVPAVAPWALGFLQLWRSRRAASPCMPPTCGHRHVQVTKKALLLPLCPCTVGCMSRKDLCFDLGLSRVTFLRCSHVTGSELLDDYVQHSIPGAYRDAWFRCARLQCLERIIHRKRNNATPVRPLELHMLRLFIWIQAQ